ncbi:peptidyl-tRNA hydrolase [Bacteroidia bacterium]|nr:peptidyl-tRNA hydrolase [Bacteroidia bacterium]GHU58357.1 peptidyl-tRNA hydrolase [Bacteroidia bacterium]
MFFPFYIQEDMKYLIVGLGNFPPEYWDTRHNIGFRVVDRMVKGTDAQFRPARYGDIAEMRLKGKDLLLLKPTTFMNLSGMAVRYWLQKEKIPDENLLVVVDDIALPFGRLRIKPKGSHGGHNGLRDIEEKLGTQEYTRLRFGVGSNFPIGRQIDYVLGEFDKDELERMTERLDMATEMVKSFCLAGIENTMNLYNNK